MPQFTLTKRCSTCRRIKPTDDFGRDKGASDGLNSQCRACRVLATDRARRKNRLEHPKPPRDGERVIRPWDCVAGPCRHIRFFSADGKCWFRCSRGVFVHEIDADSFFRIQAARRSGEERAGFGAVPIAGQPVKDLCVIHVEPSDLVVEPDA